MSFFSSFIKVTSTRDTPIYARREAVLLLEGMTFRDDEPHYPGHTGSRLTLKAGQWTETIVCIETVDAVMELIEPQPRPYKP